MDKLFDTPKPNNLTDKEEFLYTYVHNTDNKKRVSD
jgi:hypothetical protein